VSKIESEIESPKVSEVKTLFAEVEKEPFGNVFTSIFKDHTEAKSWQVEKIEELEFNELIIYGKGKEIKEEIIPLMKLSLFREEDYSGVDLEIFKGHKGGKERRKRKPDVIYRASGEEISFISPSMIFLIEEYEYAQYLDEIKKEVMFAISQARIKI